MEKEIGEMSALITDITKGGKPCGFILFKKTCANEIKKILKYEPINFLIEELEGSELAWLYLYKHEFMKEIILNAPKNPETIYERWITWKMLGYSDESFSENIKNI